VAVARFAWGDVGTGLVRNVRTLPADVLGLVLPVINGVTSVRVTRGVRYARPGVGLTLMGGGDFWVRFDSGATPGNRVYASLVDGRAISGQAGGAEPTPWYVVTDTGPGGLAIISTTSKVTS
jgi:hypothetical protein